MCLPLFRCKKISVPEFLRSARSSFLLFPIKKENRQRLYNLLSIFILKLIICVYFQIINPHFHYFQNVIFCPVLSINHKTFVFFPTFSPVNFSPKNVDNVDNFVNNSYIPHFTLVSLWINLWIYWGK